MVHFGHCLWQSFCHCYYCYGSLLVERHCLCRSLKLYNGPGWGRFSCRFRGRGLERTFLWTLLPQFSDQGQQLSVGAGDFPWLSLGSGLSRFGIFLRLVCCGFLRAGFLRSGLGKSGVDFWFPASRSRCRRFIFMAFSCFFVRSETAWRAAVASSYSLRRYCAGLCVGRGSAFCDSPAVCLLRQSAGREAFSVFRWGLRSIGFRGLRCPVRKGGSAWAWGRLAWSLTHCISSGSSVWFPIIRTWSVHYVVWRMPHVRVGQGLGGLACWYRARCLAARRVRGLLLHQCWCGSISVVGKWLGLPDVGSSPASRLHHRLWSRGSGSPGAGNCWNWSWSAAFPPSSHFSTCQ